MKKYVVTVVVLLAFILSMGAFAFKANAQTVHAQVFKLFPSAAQEQHPR